MVVLNGARALAAYGGRGSARLVARALRVPCVQLLLDESEEAEVKRAAIKVLEASKTVEKVVLCVGYGRDAPRCALATVKSVETLFVNFDSFSLSRQEEYPDLLSVKADVAVIRATAAVQGSDTWTTALQRCVRHPRGFVIVVTPAGANPKTVEAIKQKVPAEAFEVMTCAERHEQYSRAALEPLVTCFVRMAPRSAAAEGDSAVGRAREAVGQGDAAGEAGGEAGSAAGTNGPAIAGGVAGAPVVPQVVGNPVPQ